MTKKNMLAAACLSLALGIGAPAQAHAQSRSLKEVQVADLRTMKDKFVGLAEAFPADKYGWTPMEVSTSSGSSSTERRDCRKSTSCEANISNVYVTNAARRTICLRLRQGTANKRKCLGDDPAWPALWAGLRCYLDR